MILCQHDWSQTFRWLPREIRWCRKCGTWRITLDEDSHLPGYKYRYHHPEWEKDGVRVVTIGRFSLSMHPAGGVWFVDIDGEGMQCKEETLERLEKLLKEFFDREF